MSIENPPLKEHGFVTGRFILSVADTLGDGNRYPDLRAAAGRLRFTPLQTIHLYGGGDPATVIRQPVDVTLNDQGRIADAESQADPDRDPGVYLAVGQYRVDPIFEGTSGLSRFTIEVTAEHTKEAPLFLTNAYPVETPPGFTEVVRIEDRVRAEDAAEAAESHTALALVYRDEAAQSAASAESHADRAETARDEAESITGIEVDTSAGTKVTVGGVVVHYDSGWRDITASHADLDVLAEGSYFHIRRTLDTLQLVYQFNFAVSGSGQRRLLNSLPATGWRPGDSGSANGNRGAQQIFNRWFSTGAFDYYSYFDPRNGDSGDDHFTSVWITGTVVLPAQDRLPTTRPGSPA